MRLRAPPITRLQGFDLKGEPIQGLLTARSDGRCFLRLLDGRSTRFGP